MGNMRKCSVPSCLHRNRKNNEDKRSMFIFPKDARLHVWISNIGNNFLYTANQYVCESHFEPQYLRRSLDTKTNTLRCRLASNAVPTIFNNNNCGTSNELPSSLYFSNDINQQLQAAYFNNSINNQLPEALFNNSAHNQSSETSCNSSTNNQLPQSFFNNSINNYLPNTLCNNSVSDFQVSNISIDHNSFSSVDHIPTPSAETSLQEVMSDLLSSEPLLMKIKQEQLADDMLPKVKEENLEEIKNELKENFKALTAFEQLEFSNANFEKQLPQYWILTRLPLGNDKVLAFTKECTVNDNGALLTVYEKSIVLNSTGDVTYSIHGKTLNINPACTPSVLTDIDSLLDIIIKFDKLKVCRGILTTEYEVDKDCIIYKDDLGYNRHVECTLVTDSEQCNACLAYSQYLYDVVINNPAILNERPVYNYNQVY